MCSAESLPWSKRRFFSVLNSIVTGTEITTSKAFLDELRTRNGNLNIVCGKPVTRTAL